MTDHASRALRRYERDGFVIFRNVLDTGLAAQASEHVAWLQQRHPELRGEDLGHELVASDPFWVRLVSDRIMHGSAANTSPMRRCGLTIRYIPTSTRITANEQPYPSAILLRGKPGMNAYQPWPAGDPEQSFASRPG